MSYGPKSNPKCFKGCAFHPKNGENWLKRNCLNVDKKGCIEIFDAKDYLDSRKLWGIGGLILHELSHAYHDKHCENGYENEIILEAYNVAMEKKLYDNVKVHGPQGAKGTAKHYACTNCMEFFAELSTSLMYNKDDEIEFNKWFPHNSHQFKLHDPQSYSTLCSIWGISI